MTETAQDTIRKLCLELGLPEGDLYVQNWARELPDEFRSGRFFVKYAEFYERPDCGVGEKRLLMQLMLDVANDLFQQDSALGNSAWERIVRLLHVAPELHRDQVEYWTLPDESPDDVFEITPLARKLWASMYL
jgi:hypothetical protein